MGHEARNVDYQTKLGSTRPVHSKASVLTLDCGEGKYSVYCKVPSVENGQLRLKRLELSPGFWGRVFKSKLRERVAGCLISSWTFF